MGMFHKKKAPEAHVGEINPSEKPTPAETPATLTPTNNSESSLHIQTDHSSNVAPEEALQKQPVTKMAVLLGAIASIGGFMFGYESGQISGKSLNSIPTINQALMYYRFLTDERFPGPFRRRRKIQRSTTRNNCCPSVCRNISRVLGQWLDL